MAEKSRFFNAVPTPEGTPDIVYNVEQYDDYFDTLVTTGVFAEQLNSLQVTGHGSQMKTILSTGKALIKGKYYENDEVLELSHELPDPSQNRIDLVVVRRDTPNRYIKAFVLTGTPGGPAPTLTQNIDVYEIALAEVLIIAGKSFIETSEVTDLREYARYQMKPAWYPEGQVPMDAWMYVNFKEQLTEQEIIDIEANPSLMSIIDGSTTGSIINVDGVGYKPLKSQDKTHVMVAKDVLSLAGDVANKAILEGDILYLVMSTGQNVSAYNLKTNTHLFSTPSYGGAVQTFLLDSDYIYMAGLNIDTVHKCSKTTGALLATSPTFYDDIRVIVQDDEYIYAGGGNGTNAGRLRKFRKSDMAYVAQSAVDFTNDVYQMAIDDLYIYALDATSADIFRYSKSSLSSKVVIGMADSIRAIAINSGYLYMSTIANQLIKYNLATSTIEKTVITDAYRFETIKIINDKIFYPTSGYLPIYDTDLNKLIEPLSVSLGTVYDLFLGNGYNEVYLLQNPYINLFKEAYQLIGLEERE